MKCGCTSLTSCCHCYCCGIEPDFLSEQDCDHFTCENCFCIVADDKILCIKCMQEQSGRETPPNTTLKRKRVIATTLAEDDDEYDEVIFIESSDEDEGDDEVEFVEKAPLATPLRKTPGREVLQLSALVPERVRAPVPKRPSNAQPEAPEAVKSRTEADDEDSPLLGRMLRASDADEVSAAPRRKSKQPLVARPSSNNT